MRAVLALSTMLLGVTLALNHSRTLFPDAATSVAQRTLEVVAGAKGPLLSSGTIGSGPERIGEAMRIGDRTLVGTGAPGLRAAWLAPDLSLRQERCYDLANDSGAASELLSRVLDASEGEVVVLASSGSIEPSAPEALESMDRALALLGAGALPGRSTPESWALLAIRRGGAWVPLAEAYSRESGVALAYVLDPDAPIAGPADRVLVRPKQRREVFLEDELQHASQRTPGIELVRDGRVRGQSLPGILMPPSVGENGAPLRGRLVWEDVPIHEGAGFISWPGLADGASANSDGVTFEVWVDGKRFERPVRPGEPRRGWQVDLREFAGRRVEVQLAVDPGETSRGDAALWGRPVLVEGYDRPPLEVWAEER